jgi:acyl carrier protein phosphodiesterase
LLIDIFYDYFLVKNWNKHADISIEAFSDRIIDVLESYSGILPQGSKQFLQYVKQHDIIPKYANKETIKFVLEGMSKRTTILKSGIQNAYIQLEQYEDVLEDHFSRFFPLLKQNCTEYLQNLHVN